MKRIKNIIFVVALCIFSYLQVEVGQGTDIMSLYSGTVFQGNITFYVRCVFLFACYCLYTYNEFETYMSQYGVLLVTREGSRDKLMKHLAGRLLRFIVQIEGMKLMCYGVLMLLIKGAVTLSNPFELIKMIIINIQVCFILLFLQMVIEIYISGNIAVSISLACFLIGLGVSDMISSSTICPQSLNLLILLNLSMKCRLDMLIKEEQMHYAVIGVLTIVIIFMYMLVKKLFQKKDVM